jgi:phosphatidylserine/phosphatidylglycerophosphate/cardiolipin synthase-like enzyme
MDALLIATGFTGALTLLFLARKALRSFHQPQSLAVHFSPSGGCTDAVVREIAAAKREILVLAYGFTSRPISQALVDAKLRGVDVEIVLDHSNETDAHSDLHFLLEQKLTPVIDAHHAIAHNKVMLIDGRTIVTGSFNFTAHAESHNAENLVVIKGHPDLVSTYRHDFDHHKAHARAVEAGHGAASHTGEDHHGKAEHHEAAKVEHHEAASQSAQSKDDEGPATLPAADKFGRKKEKEKEEEHTKRKAA